MHELEQTIEEMEEELRRLAYKIWLDLGQPTYVSEPSKSKPPKTRLIRRRRQHSKQAAPLEVRSEKANFARRS
jgi:hypothetical protein